MKSLKPAQWILLLAFTILLGCEEDPAASFSVSKEIVETGETVIFTNTSTDAASFEWFFGDGNMSTDRDPSHAYDQPGNYNVTLVAYSKSGNKMDDAYLAFLWVIDPTVLTFNVYLNNSPLSGCEIELFDSYDSWYSDENSVASATTNTSGSVSFTGCSAKVYYADFYYDNNYFGSFETEELTLFTENTYNVYLADKQLTFNNPTFTPITIDVTGFSTRTIQVGGSTTYNVSGTSIGFSASTSEEYSNGDPLALTIYWSDNISLSGSTTNVNLNVGSSFFYHYCTNNCGYSLGPIYSNYGSSSYEVIVNASLPSDGVKYRLGYHHARWNTEVRYYYSGGYYYSENGYHFNFPNVSNQSVWVTVGGKTTQTKVGESFTKDVSLNHSKLRPFVEYQRKFKDVPNAINLYARESAHL